MKKRILYVYIPEKTYEKFLRYIDERGQSRSTAIERMIEAATKDQTNEASRESGIPE